MTSSYYIQGGMMQNHFLVVSGITNNWFAFIVTSQLIVDTFPSQWYVLSSKVGHGFMKPDKWPVYNSQLPMLALTIRNELMTSLYTNKP